MSAAALPQAPAGGAIHSLHMNAGKIMDVDGQWCGGAEAYADMTVTAPGSPVPQQNFSTGLVP